MLARTNGQLASPTRLGKEIEVFAVRLKEQFNLLNDIPSAAKFGGATVISMLIKLLTQPSTGKLLDQNSCKSN
jgi:adenylosuccinate lyase